MPRTVAAPTSLAALPGTLFPLYFTLFIGGCANVPPFIERNYARLGVGVLREPLAVENAHSTGPYLGASLTLGTFMDVPSTYATALEVEVQPWLLDPGGDLEGDGWRYLAGVRRFYNLDGRVRPNFGLGASWTDFRLHDSDPKVPLDSEDDPAGVGGYADAGVDWMFTPTFGLGARLRSLLRYEQADHEHGMKFGTEFILSAIWRF